MPEPYPLRTIEVVPFGDQLDFIDKVSSSNAQILNKNHRANRQHNYGNTYDHYNNNNNNNNNNRGQNKYALAAVAAAAVHQQQNYLQQQQSLQQNHQQSHQQNHQQYSHKAKSFDYNDYRNLSRPVMSQKPESSDYSFNQYDFNNPNYRLLNGSSPTVPSSPANNSSTGLLGAAQPSALLLSHSQPSSSQFVNQTRRFDQTNNTANLSSLSHPLRSNLYENPLLFNSGNSASSSTAEPLVFSSTGSNSATTTSLDSPNTSQPTNYRVSNSPPNLLLSTSTNTVASDQIYLNKNSSSSATKGSLGSSNVFSNSPSMLPSAPTSAGSGWSNTSPTGSTPSLIKKSSIWGPSYDTSLISSNTTLTAFGDSSNQTFGSSSMW